MKETFWPQTKQCVSHEVINKEWNEMKLPLHVKLQALAAREKKLSVRWGDEGFSIFPLVSMKARNINSI
jgi:hypothetical protein